MSLRGLWQEALRRPAGAARRGGPRAGGWLLPALALLLIVPGAQALDLRAESAILPQQERAAPVPEAVEAAPRADWSSPRYGAPPAAEPGADAGEDAPPPFGSQLFEGGFRATRGEGLNPGYRVMPGDQVNLRVWGAVEVERQVPVDAQGNLFLPGIGPIPAQGLTPAELAGAVRGAFKEVYPENVEVYTQLQGIQPVAVYVTGYVQSPGRYAGTPSDSVLYFLAQANGIDPALGSYRRVRVQRGGAVIARVDLYDFLLDGRLPAVQFRDGDTVVVGEQGPTVIASGDVQRAYRYELEAGELEGETLLRLARLATGVSHALVRGSGDAGPYSAYVTIEELAGRTLRPGDEVLFSRDRRDEQMVVQVEGSFYGPSRYVLPRGTRLHQLLDAIAVPRELTATESVSLRRESVAEQQRESLRQSLRRLETTYLGTPSATAEEAQIRAREAELISDFVARARQTEPSGRLVLARGDRIVDVRLQDGDVITIPEVSDSVLVSGEVVMPQSVVHTPGQGVMDYIASAGGFTRHADDDRILIARQNGEIVDAAGERPRSGDEIIVLPKVPTKNLQLAAAISEILYQIAVATRVAVDL